MSWKLRHPVHLSEKYRILDLPQWPAIPVPVNLTSLFTSANADILQHTAPLRYG